jgi:Flp pilus assembly protein protease CpaA
MVPVSEFAAAGFLLYGSYKDIKTREIPDSLWAAMGITGIAFRIQDHQWKIMAISCGVALLIGLILAISGLFGGADIKVLLALSLLIPTYPGTVAPVFVVTVFNNVVVIRVAEILAVFFYNIVKGNEYHRTIPVWKKILLYMTGVPRSRETLDYRFLPLQDVKGTLHLLPDIDIDIEQFKKECELKEIWATYGSPLIFYVMIGCIIAFLGGDLILHLMIHLV